MRPSEATTLKRLCRLFIFLIASLQLCPAATDLKKLPAPTGYVSDLAGVVNASDKDQLEEFCTRVDHELGVQFALVTVDTVGDTSIRDFALQLARHWGVGDKKNNEGVLLLLAVKDHKSDIETGRGTEPYLTDGFSGGTLRAMRPQLRAGDYGPALMAAAQEMARQIAQGKNIAFTIDGAQAPDLGPGDMDRRNEPRPRRRSSGGGLSVFVLIIFVLLWLFGRGGRGGRRGGGGRYGGGGGGFLTGMLLGNVLGGRGYGGGGNWGSSGGFGGGDSGGSGGFGGFGGGDFGGGGASSDW